MEHKSSNEAQYYVLSNDSEMKILLALLKETIWPDQVLYPGVAFASGPLLSKDPQEAPR